MKDNRHICNKTYMTERQHNNLVADARAARKSVSTLLCECWENSRDGKAQRRQIPRPNVAPFRAQFLPGRASRGFANMRH